MAMIAGLTRYQRKGSRCTCTKADGVMCGAKCNEQCCECSEPLCGMHIGRHYRLEHPRLI